ncbi:hypothetical protein BKA60DRAFT_580833 [Fusarium oxysporum]|nr:hypothetical protein BKA60DRAFT_580833 [Fusarium oxysporum]
MSSPPILDEIQVITFYDGKSFLDERHSRRIWPDSSTWRSVAMRRRRRGSGPRCVVGSPSMFVSVMLQFVRPNIAGTSITT